MRIPEYGSKPNQTPSRVGRLVGWICVLATVAVVITICLWIHSFTYRVYSVPR